MRLLNGRAAHGVGSFGINIADLLLDGTIRETQLAQPAGVPAWVRDGFIAGQGFVPAVGDWRVLAGPSTGPLTPLWGDWMADRFYAGGGTIAAGWTGHGTRIVNEATRSTLRGYAEVTDVLPYDVDPLTGAVLLVDEVAFIDLLIYHASHPIVDAAGARLPPDRVVSTGDSFLWPHLRGDLVSWTSVRVRAVSPDAPGLVCQPGGQKDCIIHTLPSGARWVTYLNGDGHLFAHPVATPNAGHVFRGGTFTYDAEVLGDALVVACATDAGESIVPGATRMFLWSTTSLEDLTPAPAPPPAIAVIGKPMWFGWFEFAGRPTQVGSNCGVAAGEGMIRTSNGVPIGRFIAVAGDEGNLDALERATADAQRATPGLIIVPYWTRQAQTIGPPRGAKAVGVEAYQRAGEPDDVFEARIRGSVRQVPRAWLLGQVYDSNTNNTADLTTIPPVLARIARDEPNVDGFLNFSGSGRRTGLQDHPEVWPLWAAVFAGIIPGPGRVIVLPPAPPPTPDPPVVPPPPPPPPEPESGVITMEVPNVLLEGVYRLTYPRPSTIALTPIADPAGSPTAPLPTYPEVRDAAAKVLTARNATDGKHVADGGSYQTGVMDAVRLIIEDRNADGSFNLTKVIADI